MHKVFRGPKIPTEVVHHISNAVFDMDTNGTKSLELANTVCKSNYVTSDVITNYVM